jgi:zinc protease
MARRVLEALALGFALLGAGAWAQGDVGMPTVAPASEPAASQAGTQSVERPKQPASAASQPASSPAASQPATAQAEPAALPAGITKVRSVEGIDEYHLANGLQILLFADDSKPTTTVNLTYRVGSRMENYGETGMAHLLEHMLFKGTPTHPNAFAEFEKRGLAANGSTSFDRTNYSARFSANPENLEWYLGWLADAMVNSTITRADLDTEMTVVRNEMERGENSPDSSLVRQTMAAMYDWHNYGKATIGARSDVENVGIPQLRAFYRLYYQPDNATLIVAGKFEPAQVLDWVAQRFGVIARPTRKLPVLYTLDPAQDGERSVTVRREGGAPLVFAAYHVPAGPDPDFAAIQMLAMVLGETPSGRLHKRLTEQQLASSTFAFAWALHDPGVMITGAELAPGQDVDKARDALLAVDESIAAQPIAEDEVERVKTKWLKRWEQSFSNPESVGLRLSESVAQGDWRLYFLNRDRVRAVRAADVQRVAEQWLLRSNRTVGVYLPTPKPERAPAPQRVDVAAEMKDFKPQQAAAAVPPFEATPANIDASTQRSQLGGLKLALLHKPTRGQTVQATLVLRFGDEKSLFGQGDVPDALAALLDKGTASLTRQQVQDRLDALQTLMSIGNAPGRVSVSLATRREHLPAAIALVGDLLRHPALPPEALSEWRRQALTGIAQQRHEPDALAGNTIGRIGNPYPRGDVRYTPTFDEMVEDVNAVTLDQVRAFHDRFYGAAVGEFAAVGDFDTAAVSQALKEAFGDWQRGAPFARVPSPFVAVPPARRLLETPGKQNAVMLVRQSLPIAELDPDYAALMMANYLLGGGGNSRLWKRIREADGLSYDVRSGIGWDSFEANSDWQASAIYAPQNRAKVEAAFREVVAQALKEGFSAEELEAGQRGLLSYRRLGRAQDASVAVALVNNLYLDRTFAVSAKVDRELAALTVEQVNAALRKYLKPDDFVAVYAGDFAR